MLQWLDNKDILLIRKIIDSGRKSSYWYHYSNTIAICKIKNIESMWERVIEYLVYGFKFIIIVQIVYDSWR